MGPARACVSEGELGRARSPLRAAAPFPSPPLEERGRERRASLSASTPDMLVRQPAGMSPRTAASRMMTGLLSPTLSSKGGEGNGAAASEHRDTCKVQGTRSATPLWMRVARADASGDRFCLGKRRRASLAAAVHTCVVGASQRLCQWSWAASFSGVFHNSSFPRATPEMRIAAAGKGAVHRVGKKW